MKKIKTILLLAASVVGLAGCNTMSTEIIEMSPGIYTVSGENPWVDDSGYVRIDLMKQAAAYCAKQGKKLNVIRSSGSDGYFIQGYVNGSKSSTAQVDFSCVDAQ